MKDFIKKHIHALINVFGIILTVLFTLSNELIFNLFFTETFGYILLCIVILSVLSNIIAFVAFKKKNKALAIVCSVIFGSIGGLIAVKYDTSINKKIKIIFHIHMWLVAMSICGYFGGIYYIATHF